MGAKQTKIDGIYLPETPNAETAASFAPCTLGAMALEGNIDIQDPRSPNVCRTPINIFTSKSECADEDKNVKTNRDTESTVGQLRRRFLKGFTYNLNDPRSPAHQFNRSPLCFDDSQDKILNLDDTFSDLFAETQGQCKVTEQKISNLVDTIEDFPQKEKIMTNEKLTYDDFLCADEKSISNTKVVVVAEENKESSLGVVEEYIPVEKEDLKLPDTPPPQLTPKILQDECDPRSPTIGVDRTPIIFNDDDEANEGVLLESILATLSLDMSDTSICSIPTNNEKTTPVGGTNRTDRQGQLFRKITHKRMRRAQGNEKIPLVTRRVIKDLQSTPQRVFEDSENEPNLNAAKSLKLKQKNENGIKRTPLSCLKNSNINARVAADKTKLIKTRLEYAADEGMN
ncbi:uncharacterized protein LOC101457924 [Ceratitis capitata]|uniref:uncharacterized protein LOC101457924 n=1 Tax=Ceratitis capitata TaxID=7213 RepID=UPI00032A0FEE|nr:uncharacterized protein LOC101457924 [Ceratitis capitata]